MLGARESFKGKEGCEFLRLRFWVHFLRFWVLYGWAEVWKEPLSCSPCWSQGQITAARHSVITLLFLLPCFPLLHHRLKQQVPQDSKQYFILCLGSICLVHWQRLFSTNLYYHRKNSFSQMQYWFSCSPKINMTSCLKQPYLPSRS